MILLLSFLLLLKHVATADQSLQGIDELGLANSAYESGVRWEGRERGEKRPGTQEKMA